VLLDNYLIHQLALLDRQNKLRAETAPILPFSDRLLALEDARRNLETINQAAIARTLADVAKQVDSLRAGFEPPVARPALLGDRVHRARRPTKRRTDRRRPDRRGGPQGRSPLRDDSVRARGIDRHRRA